MVKYQILQFDYLADFVASPFGSQLNVSRAQKPFNSSLTQFSVVHLGTNIAQILVMPKIWWSNEGELRGSCLAAHRRSLNLIVAASSITPLGFLRLKLQIKYGTSSRLSMYMRSQGRRT